MATLRILMTGNDYNYLKTDGEMLRQRGFSVYICERNDLVDDLVQEVKPDVVFINSQKPDKSTTEVYHHLIDNVTHASVPVIFTLLEDDVYLINRKRTAAKDRRYIMSDNIVDAIKKALTPFTPVKKHVNINTQLFGNNGSVHRA